MAKVGYQDLDLPFLAQEVVQNNDTPKKGKQKM